MGKTNEVTHASQSAHVPAAINFAADAGQGLELADNKSFAIPFLLVLQGQSPQLETVDGARPGRFFNTVTEELYEKVMAIPCCFRREYIRWAPRKMGGGYKGVLDAKAVDMRQVEGLTEYQGQLFMDVPVGQSPVDEEGKAKFDTLSDTRNHFVLVQSARGNWQPAMLSMKSTQIKKSKRWLSLIKGIEMKDAHGRLFTPASYSHTYELVTVKEENAEGTWWGIDVKLGAPVADALLYAAAKAFHDSVMSGLIEVATPPEGA